MARLLAVALFLSLFLFTALTQPKTIRVPQDHVTIQAAINAAVNGDTVLVDEGTYFVNLLLQKKITLASRFLLDLDPMHISRTILDGSTPTVPELASVIRISTGTDSTTVIAGFTIRGGTGTRYNETGTARFWRMGGGICISGGGASIRNNTIRDNWIDTSTDGADGGGIGMWPYEGIILPWAIRDNVIAKNVAPSTATLSGLAAEGGGAYLFGNGTFELNTMDSNSVSGYSIGRGGGLCLVGSYGYGASFATVANNRFRFNSSKFNGGAIFVIGSSAAPANVLLIYNLISNNAAVRNGGGIFASSYSIVKIINNTIVNNTSPGFGAGLFVSGSLSSAAHASVRGMNNIFWNVGAFPNEIWGADLNSFHYNLIRGESLLGLNNFTADPQFLSDGSYRLAAGSPCIGAGVSSLSVLGSILQTQTIDLTGHSVPQPSGSNPDLGAIESDLGTTTADRPHRVLLHSFMHDGVQRWYGVVRPRGRESESKRPVLIYLNSYDGPSDVEMNWLGIQPFADTAGFVTAYPEAFLRRWNSGITTGTSYPTPSVNDVAFISALIDSLSVQYAIDSNRVFVAGYSNGGFMAYRLAAQLAHRIAGIVACGARLPSIASTAFSTLRRVPVMIVNGTFDNIVPYSDSHSNWWTVPVTVQFWRDKNGATTARDIRTIDGNPTDGSSVTLSEFGFDLPYDTRGIKPIVRLYTVTGGGHEWPGSPTYYGAGNINRDFSLNAEMFRFFEETVAPAASADSRTVRFGNILTAHSDTIRLMINNFYRPTFTLTSLSHDRSEFSINTTPALPVGLSPGTSVGLQIVFQPNVPGNVRDSIAFVCDDSVLAGQTIILDGRGIESIALADSGAFYLLQGGTTSASLLRLNPLSLATTHVGMAGVANIRTMSVHPLKKVLYGVGTRDGTTTLFRVSADSGAAVRHRTLAPLDITAMSFGNGDTMFGATSNGRIFRLDVSTGNIIDLGYPHPNTAFTSLAFDRMSGRLWATAVFPRDSVYSIDPVTGSKVAVSPLPYASRVTSMAFDHVGTWYALVDNGTGDFYLVTINTSTFEATLVNESPIGVRGLTALAIGPGGPTTIVSANPDLPISYSLNQNYPNPFNPETKIGYRMKERGWVRLSVMNVLGQEVAVLVDGEKEAGYHEAVFSSQYGVGRMASGVYFYQMSVKTESGERIESLRKMVLLK